MRKIILTTIITSALLLSGCGNNRDMQPGNYSLKNETGEIQTNSTTYTPNEFTIPEIGIKIRVPASEYLYRDGIEKSNEKNRRGSFVSYNFLYKQPGVQPVLQEIQLFNENSIKQFATNCSDAGFCFEGSYPDLATYNALSKAFDAGKDYLKYKLKIFNGRSYFASTEKCSGDSCSIREYITFYDDTMISIWINIPNKDVTEEQADELFEQFEIL